MLASSQSIASPLPLHRRHADSEQDYQCEDCGGILTLRRFGIFVTGRCSGCGREIEFELPDEAFAEPVLVGRSGGEIPESTTGGQNKDTTDALQRIADDLGGV